MATLERWRRWWKDADCDGKADKAFNRFMPLYLTPDRHYHNADHINFCLDELDRFKLHSHEQHFDYTVVEMALWLHDAKPDEMQSAELALDIARKAGLSSSFLCKLELCIVATDHSPHARQLLPTHEMQLTADIDLLILASPEDRYDLYRLEIRQEHNNIPDEIFKRARIKFLATMLQKERIYRLDFYHDAYDKRARINMAREILELVS